MTIQEFSNTFDTLLNSYNTQAQFGEQASKREIVLDEYEKSVLLTQAQDIIVKSYFDGSLNPQGQGFDDSTRRQVDFSSLIKVAELSRVFVADTKSVPLNIEYSGDTIATDIVMNVTSSNPKPYNVQVQFKYATTVTSELDTSTDDTIIFRVACTNAATLKDSLNLLAKTIDASYEVNVEFTGNPTTSAFPPITEFKVIGSLNIEGIPSASNFDDRGILFNLPKKVVGNKEVTDVLFILNEKLKVTLDGVSKDYVIVPISYKEYDREMSKAYAQPLKKQAWRLFQNQATGFDINSELIPRFNTNIEDSETYIYKIRYVKRPQPIVLENLPNNLEIDGESGESGCELNPILHMDILNKAVELAIATRGGGPVTQQQK